MSKTIRITAFAVFVLTTPAIAEEAVTAPKEWHLNNSNSKLPQAGDHRPDYYFQSVVQVNLYTPTMFIDNTLTNVSIPNFRSPSYESNYLTKQNRMPAYNTKWDYRGRGSHLPASMTTKDVEAKIKELIPTGNPVVQDAAAFGSGYCLGKVLYAGKIGVIQQLPKYDINNWKKNVNDAIEYMPDSALCFGPVSKSPQILQFETPDIRALKETLLVISGLYPIDCKKKEGSDTDHICEFTSKGSVVTGPQSQ